MGRVRNMLAFKRRAKRRSWCPSALKANRHHRRLSIPPGENICTVSLSPRAVDLVNGIAAEIGVAPEEALRRSLAFYRMALDSEKGQAAAPAAAD
jgi:hypothetical protein